MPINTNVDKCIAQIVPTPDDYFLYFPKMQSKVSADEVNNIIIDSEILHNTFCKWCNDHESLVLISPQLALESYMQLLHTVVCHKLNIKHHSGIKIPE